MAVQKGVGMAAPKRVGMGFVGLAVCQNKQQSLILSISIISLFFFMCTLMSASVERERLGVCTHIARSSISKHVFFFVFSHLSIKYDFFNVNINLQVITWQQL